MFLDRLPMVEGQFIEVRCVRPDIRGAHAIFCRSLDETIRVVGRWRSVGNVYLGACPRARRSGRRSAIKFVTAAWADLDFHAIEPSNRRRAESVAHRRLDGLGRRPTILVHSGNGLQCWWRFAEPIVISGDWPGERFEAINRGVARAIGGDAVHDLARVLRVPGTMNFPDTRKRARGCVPVMARLVSADGPTYSPEDFQDLEVKEPRTSRPREVAHATVTSPRQSDAEILEVFADLLTELGSWHPLARTWRGDRCLNDSSRSGFDMALVNQLVRAGVKDRFIPAIVRAYRHGRGVLASDAYIARTLAKAKAAKGARHGAA